MTCQVAYTYDPFTFRLTNLVTNRAGQRRGRPPRSYKICSTRTTRSATWSNSTTTPTPRRSSAVPRRSGGEALPLRLDLSSDASAGPRAPGPAAAERNLRDREPARFRIRTICRRWSGTPKSTATTRSATSRRSCTRRSPAARPGPETTSTSPASNRLLSNNDPGATRRHGGVHVHRQRRDEQDGAPAGHRLGLRRPDAAREPGERRRRRLLHLRRQRAARAQGLPALDEHDADRAHLYRRLGDLPQPRRRNNHVTGHAGARDAARDGRRAPDRDGRDEDHRHGPGGSSVALPARQPPRLGGDGARPSGRVITYEEYHSFGSTAFRSADGASEVSPKRYRYTGKEKDEETGLYYHGARYYAPWLGRWTAADPAGFVDGPNQYAYCLNRPVSLSDPDGRQTGQIVPTPPPRLPPPPPPPPPVEPIPPEPPVFRPPPASVPEVAPAAEAGEAIISAPAAGFLAALLILLTPSNIFTDYTVKYVDPDTHQTLTFRSMDELQGYKNKREGEKRIAPGAGDPNAVAHAPAADSGKQSIVVPGAPGAAKIAPPAAGTPPKVEAPGTSTDKGPIEAAAPKGPKWGNPKSRPTYGHTFLDHTSALTKEQLADRARDLGHQVGQWTDDTAAARFLAEQVAKKGPGTHDVTIPQGLGRSFLGDGTALTTDMARIVVKPDGTIRTAFPFNSFNPH